MTTYDLPLKSIRQAPKHDEEQIANRKCSLAHVKHPSWPPMKWLSLTSLVDSIS